MTSILPPAETTFIDLNGAPLAGGSVYFYIPNTLTPKDTYKDQAATILNTNPVVLDSAGRATIWGSGAYRQIVNDVNGNLVWDAATLDLTTDISNYAAAAAASALSASVSAALALASQSAANLSANAASASATTAVNAANSAVNGVSYYGTLSALQANLVPAAGAGARVVSDPTLSNNGFYTKVGGTGTGSWAYVGADPVVTEMNQRIAAINAIRDYITDTARTLPGFCFNWFDLVLNSIGGITNEGLFHIYRSYLDNVSGGVAQFNQIIVDSVSSIISRLPPGYLFAVPDKYGNIGWGSKTDGSLSVQNMQLVNLNGTSVALIINNTPGLHPNIPAAYCIIPMYGQSLSLGVDAAATSTTPLAGALKLWGFTTNSGGGDIEHYTGLVAETENTEITPTTGNVRESPAYGTAQGLGELLTIDNSLALGATSTTPIMCCPGENGAPISGLSKGSAQYQVFMNQITAIVGYVAAITGGLVVCPAFAWFQAEADYNLIRTSATTPAVYKAALIQLQSDLQTDISAITGQNPSTYPIPCITYQCDSHLEHGVMVPSLGMIHYELASTNANFSLGPVMYSIPHNVGTGQGTVDYAVHSTPPGYKQMGAYTGRTFKRIVMDLKALNTCFLSYKSFTAQGNVIQIRCNVPRLPLVIDTTTIVTIPPGTPNTNYGFKLRNPSTFAEVSGTINVQIIQDLILLTCYDPSNNPLPVAGKLLTIAWDGVIPESGYPITGASLYDRPRTNIRDSSGDPAYGGWIFDPNGINTTMPYWLPMWQYQF